MLHHHELQLISVNDVYAFDDQDSTSRTPRGGWSRAATLMRRIKSKASTNTTDGGPSRTSLVVANGDLLGGSSLLVG